MKNRWLWGPVLSAMVAMSAPATARADWEIWMPVEVRLPVLRAPSPTLGRVDWRVIAEARFSGRTEGLEQLFMRTGPVVYVAPFMFVAAHVAFTTDALGGAAPIRMEEELRAELEPTFFGRVGPMTLVSRNRYEYRWRQTFQRTRVRSQLRVNLAPQGWRITPFLQAELFFDLTDTRLDSPATRAAVSPTPGFSQVRAFAGLGLQLASNIRLDVAFLVRRRLVAAMTPGEFEGTLDEGLWLQLFVDIPPLH